MLKNKKTIASDFDYIGIIGEKIMLIKEKPNFKSFTSFDEEIFLFHDIKTNKKYKMSDFEYIQKVNDIGLDSSKLLLEEYKEQLKNETTKNDEKVLKKVNSIENNLKNFK